MTGKSLVRPCTLPWPGSGWYTAARRRFHTSSECGSRPDPLFGAEKPVIAVGEARERRQMAARYAHATCTHKTARSGRTLFFHSSPPEYDFLEWTLTYNKDGRTLGFDLPSFAQTLEHFCPWSQFWSWLQSGILDYDWVALHSHHFRSSIHITISLFHLPSPDSLQHYHLPSQSGPSRHIDDPKGERIRKKT